jgi:hypothetical protein
MRQILADIEAGEVTAELRRRGILPNQRLRVIADSIEAGELQRSASNGIESAFDWLADEPDLYSDADLIERFRR